MKLQKFFLSALSITLIQVGASSFAHADTPREFYELEKTTERLAKSYEKDLKSRPGQPSKNAIQFNRRLENLEDAASDLLKDVKKGHSPKRIDSSLDEVNKHAKRAADESRDLRLSDKTRDLLRDSLRLTHQLERQKHQLMPAPPAPAPHPPHKPQPKPDQSKRPEGGGGDREGGRGDREGGDRR